MFVSSLPIFAIILGEVCFAVAFPVVRQNGLTHPSQGQVGVKILGQTLEMQSVDGPTDCYLPPSNRGGDHATLQLREWAPL